MKALLVALVLLVIALQVLAGFSNRSAAENALKQRIDRIEAAEAQALK